MKNLNKMKHIHTIKSLKHNLSSNVNMHKIPNLNKAEHLQCTLKCSLKDDSLKNKTN